MVLAPVSVAPGLYKIFDEILVNAADNKARDPKMDTLRVDIDPVRGRKAPAGGCPIPWYLRWGTPVALRGGELKTCLLRATTCRVHHYGAIVSSGAMHTPAITEPRTNRTAIAMP